MKDNKGVTLVELMIAMAIFSIVLAGVYTVYITTAKHSFKGYKEAESEMELLIVKNFIERDIAMAGYGLANNYDFDEDGIQNFIPIAIGATDGSVNAPDTLTLMGTAIGRLSRAAQGWTNVVAKTPTFQTWNDARENLEQNDRVIYMEPNTQTLLASAATWQFNYPDSPATIQEGTLVYGINTTNSKFPYYAVEYSMGGAAHKICAPGAQELERAESRNNIPPLSNERISILPCILDLQVAFGLDTDEDGTVETWDNGGAITALPPYDDYATLIRQLKQVRVYILAQSGSRNPDEDVYPYGASFRVGDTVLGIGRDITLTDEQRRYRWRVVFLSITPKNLR